ncbi:mariner Mos1 transposase [Trichonephila clavipes]|nr:mariner Mos1 transposase [Trichonephila clavipes]
MLSIWWDQLGVVYYELLKLTETVTGDRYRTQLMCLSRALKDKRSQYNERHDKVILQHDNAQTHVAKVVKTYLETLKCEVLPHPPYSPDVAPLDYHLFRSMAHSLADQHFRSYEEAKNWIDSWIASKDDQFFKAGFICCPKDGRK